MNDINCFLYGLSTLVGSGVVSTISYLDSGRLVRGVRMLLGSMNSESSSIYGIIFISILKIY